MRNQLQHHGIKGMKWGVRRDRETSSSGRREKSEDYLRAKELKKKRSSELSNAELKALNNRMQLENNYKNLKRQNVSAGRKFVSQVLYESAKNEAVKYTQKHIDKGIKYIGQTIQKEKYKTTAYRRFRRTNWE